MQMTNFVAICEYDTGGGCCAVMCHRCRVNEKCKSLQLPPPPPPPPPPMQKVIRDVDPRSCPSLSHSLCLWTSSPPPLCSIQSLEGRMGDASKLIQTSQT